MCRLRATSFHSWRSEETNRIRVYKHCPPGGGPTRRDLEILAELASTLEKWNALYRELYSFVFWDGRPLPVRSSSATPPHQGRSDFTKGTARLITQLKSSRPSRTIKRSMGSFTPLSRK
jgi:hypothetical protein